METTELDDSLSEYRRSIRGRATESIEHLRSSLRSTPVVPPGQRRSRSHSPVRREFNTSSSAWESSRITDHCDYSYGAAVDSLRSMLRKHEPRPTGPKTVQFSPRSLGHEVPMYQYSPPYPSSPAATSVRIPLAPRGEIPTPEEAVPLLQNQSGLVKQLETENRFYKDEMKALKLKLRELLDENRLLHEELKKTVVHELLREGLDIPGVPKSMAAELGRPLGGAASSEAAAGPMTQQYLGKWQKELERIHALHTAKTTRLEAQLAHSRDEQERAEREAEDLRSRLRMSEAFQNVDPEIVGLASGLCIRCGQNEAVLPPSAGAMQKASIDRITRERDELMEQLTTLRAHYQEVKHREEDACQQVKKSVEMVEQAQLEQMQALVQKEQLREELLSMKRRVEEHVEEMQRKMSEERVLVRKESKVERDELNTKIKEMTESLVETQNQLEKVTRDKISLLTELQTARGQIDSFDTDYGQATGSMKVGITQATLERNSAIQQMQRLRKELDRVEDERDQERSRLKTELDAVRRRLHQAEKELVETKEQCIHLTNTTQGLEREAHLARMAKETIEKNRTDDLKQIQQRAEQRETELNMMLDSLETRHTRTTGELEGLVNSHGGLVQKLREECRKLTSQLENTTYKYKNDNKKLKTQNEQLKARLERSLTRLNELEDGHSQQGLLQEKMRDRIKQMDEHAQHSSQQILEMLAKESSLLRDRQLLGREVEFLRRQLTMTNESDWEKLHNSHTGVVDEIICNIKHENEETENDLLGKGRKAPPGEEVVIE